MYSSYEIEGYVFDTTALRDALNEVEYKKDSNFKKYSPNALEELLKFFCDWSPNVSGIDSTYGYVNTAPHEGVRSLTEGEKEAYYETFCSELATKLNEQYSTDITDRDIIYLSHSLVNGATQDTQYDFLLKYLRRFAEHFDSLDPNSGGDIDEFLDRTRSLYSGYIETKRDQYSGAERRQCDGVHREGGVYVASNRAPNQCEDGDLRGLHRQTQG